MTETLNKIIKYCLYSLSFLLPVFFSPFSFEIYDFNKQYLLFFLSSFAFLAWMARMIICDKEIKFNKNLFNIPVLIFVFSAILSTIFSIDKISSLSGFYGRFSDNLIGIISLGIFYFLVVNNIKSSVKTEEISINNIETKKKKSTPKPASINGLINALLWSSFSAVVLTFCSLFGVWQIINNYLPKIANFQLPLTIFNRAFNPTGGTLEALVMFLSVMVVLSIGLLFLKQTSRLKSVFLVLLILMCVFLLVVVDFTPAWLILGITLLLFLIYAFRSRVFREKTNWLIIPIFLILLSIAFLFLQTSKFGLTVSGFNILNPPKEILLDQKTSWQVAIGSVKEYPVLGSGIGTFVYDFSKFKSKEFNDTYFWYLRFNKAGSQVSENVSTTGILGFLSWLAIVGLFSLASYFLFRSKKNDTEYQLPLIFAFFALIISQFVYYQNTVLSFTFWLILGLSVVSWQKPNYQKNISFKDFPEVSLVFKIILIVVCIIILGSWFFAARFYLSDLKYREGRVSGNIESLEKAVNLNKNIAIFRTTLSQAYLADALQEGSKSTEKQDIGKIQADLAKAINEGKKATILSPHWVDSFENLGVIYRNLKNVAQGATNWAIDSFSKAAKLEPTNPVIVTEIGKIYKNDENITEAKKEFEKALELKPNYADAKIQLALIYESENDIGKAISSLEDMAKQNSNVEIYFQLGRLYYNNNQISDAIAQFQRALALMPNHQNSLYSLGIAYQKQGNKEKALEIFENLLKLNPENQEIISKIAELNKPSEEKKK